MRGANAGNFGQGSKWIRTNKRLLIYERDGWCCVWCGSPVKAAGKVPGPHVRACNLASLDHVLPRSRGGTNDAHNLVTACIDCNSLRDGTSAVAFAFAHLPEPHAALERMLTAMLTPLAATVPACHN